MANRSDSISIRISSADKAELQSIAQEERRTVSQLAALIIEDWLKARREGTGGTITKGKRS
jgi:predicted transcriptional regulator